jgi:hypothetical protein
MDVSICFSCERFFVHFNIVAGFANVGNGMPKGQAFLTRSQY